MSNKKLYAINDPKVKWKVSFLMGINSIESKKSAVWYAHSDISTGIDSFNSENVYYGLNSKYNAKRNWELFAVRNGITNYEFVN